MEMGQRPHVACLHLQPL